MPAYSHTDSAHHEWQIGQHIAGKEKLAIAEQGALLEAEAAGNVRYTRKVVAAGKGERALCLHTIAPAELTELTKSGDKAQLELLFRGPSPLAGIPPSAGVPGTIGSIRTP
jgi:hypothetical protein